MATYTPHVYRQQGATELVVSSGGYISIEDGGVINLESGGEIQINGTHLVTTGGGLALASLTSGNVTFPSAVTVTGAFKSYLETLTSSASAVVAYGISVVTGCSSGEVVMALGAPAAGVHKYVVAMGTSVGATGAAILTSSGASAGIGPSGFTSILLTNSASAPSGVHLVGQNSTAWWAVSFTTDVSFSAT